METEIPGLADVGVGGGSRLLEAFLGTVVLVSIFSLKGQQSSCWKLGSLLDFVFFKAHALEAWY